MNGPGRQPSESPEEWFRSLRADERWTDDAQPAPPRVRATRRPVWLGYASVGAAFVLAASAFVVAPMLTHAQDRASTASEATPEPGAQSRYPVALEVSAQAGDDGAVAFGADSGVQLEAASASLDSFSLRLTGASWSTDHDAIVVRTTTRCPVAPVDVWARQTARDRIVLDLGDPAICVGDERLLAVRITATPTLRTTSDSVVVQVDDRVMTVQQSSTKVVRTEASETAGTVADAAAPTTATWLLGRTAIALRVSAATCGGASSAQITRESATLLDARISQAPGADSGCLGGIDVVTVVAPVPSDVDVGAAVRVRIHEGALTSTVVVRKPETGEDH